MTTEDETLRRRRHFNHKINQKRMSKINHNNNNGRYKNGGSGAIKNFEKYIALAKENMSTDHILAERYLQHAEHYYRQCRDNGEMVERQQQQEPQDEERSEDVEKVPDFMKAEIVIAS